MKTDNIIKRIMALKPHQEFQCRVDTQKQAVHLMFRLTEKLLGDSKPVTTRKLGRYNVGAEADYEGCICHYNAETFCFTFKSVPHTTELVSTFVEAEERKEKARAKRRAEAEALAQKIKDDACTPEDFDFEAHTLRCRASRRGGGIEIDLTALGYPGKRMSAWQNYLGGGMLGSIGSACGYVDENGHTLLLRDWQDDDTLVAMSNLLERYYHSLTNPDDEWEGMSFEKRQSMPESAY